jgi:branched-chain amino acid aminotransferase
MSNVKIWRISPVDYNLDLVELPERAPQSINEAAKRLPQGVYTTFRTFKCGKTLPLEPHFIRLEESARLINKSIALNHQRIKDHLRDCMNHFDLSTDSRIRVSIDLENKPGEIYLVFESLITPTVEEYENGVKTITTSFQRQNPKAKVTNHLSEIDKIKQTMPCSVNEILLLDKEGHILEGLTSNFFAVKNGSIWTAEEGVLQGIIRSITLELAQKNEVKVNLGPISAIEIECIEEAFITSASRSILPVTTIDQIIIGNGKPGKVTQKLSGAYWKYIGATICEV